jgi:predicted DNA-binding transcriptional regulator YafY
MTSQTYQIFRQAVLEKKQVTCTYHDLYREICPHTLGYTNGQEQALSFQFAGQSSKGLPPGGEWRCMKLDEVIGAKLRDGPWHTAPDHSRPQTCVKQIDVEVAFAAAAY